MGIGESFAAAAGAINNINRTNLAARQQAFAELQTNLQTSREAPLLNAQTRAAQLDVQAREFNLQQAPGEAAFNRVMRGFELQGAVQDLSRGQFDMQTAIQERRERAGQAQRRQREENLQLRQLRTDTVLGEAALRQGIPGFEGLMADPALSRILNAGQAGGAVKALEAQDKIRQKENDTILQAEATLKSRKDSVKGLELDAAATVGELLDEFESSGLGVNFTRSEQQGYTDALVELLNQGVPAQDAVNEVLDDMQGRFLQLSSQTGVPVSDPSALDSGAATTPAERLQAQLGSTPPGLPTPLDVLQAPARRTRPIGDAARFLVGQAGDAALNAAGGAYNLGRAIERNVEGLFANQTFQQRLESTTTGLDFSNPAHLVLDPATIDPADPLVVQAARATNIEPAELARHLAEQARVGFSGQLTINQIQRFNQALAELRAAGGR